MCGAFLLGALVMFVIMRAWPRVRAWLETPIWP